MAKQEELKKTILRMLQLPKAVTQGLIFQNQQRLVHKYHERDGPKRSIKMIPDEARRRSKQGGSGDRAWDRHIYLTEPTSPTVSCMGQVKIQRQNQQRLNNNKKRTSTFQRIRQPRRRKSSCAPSDAHGGSTIAAPALRQLNRFASGRAAFENFDWKAHAVAPEDDDQTTISFTQPTSPASI
ncbi:hypothetical protein QN277_018207 [Acacia crassicarpa]|uniref:Uncharacterized protein n=1 Tax=Acacia crassicarpa TaxID=499986 RepID=A0AAE1JQ21_9FABA|nr:hypothetical protein QN277_018207 [Acacia crassicarpa]